MVMLGRSSSRAVLLVLLMFSAAFSGCFGETEQSGINSEKDVVVTPQTLSGGIFQPMTITAKADLSVFVPYLIFNEDNGFVQNSTVIDLKSDESVQLSVLAPPRTDTAVVGGRIAAGSASQVQRFRGCWQRCPCSFQISISQTRILE